MSASRQSVPRAPAFDTEAGWEKIKIGVGKNLTTPETEKPMDMKEYMAHYTAIHNFCLHQKVARGNSNAKSDDGGAHLLGGDLYTHLQDLLTEHLQEVRKRIIQRDDDSILKRYLQEWKQYHAGAHRNAKMMSYLNRHWCLREIDEGNPDVYEVYPSHIILWDEVILDVSQDIVREVIVGLVEKKRSGEAVDEELVSELLEASRWRLADGVLLQTSSASGTAGFEEESKLGKVIPDIYQLLLDPPAGETDEQILFRAVQRSYKPTLSYLFTHSPLSPDTKDSAGRTPLSHAAYNADADLILFLLSSGANVNVQDNDGVAPLSWAVRNRGTRRKIESTVRLLLEKGADVEARDGQGYTALDWAKKDKSVLNEPVMKALEEALGPAKLAAHEEEVNARVDESE